MSITPHSSHCVGIIAHKAEPQLKWLVEELIAQGFSVLVHADRKNYQRISESLKGFEDVLLKNAIPVFHGHISLVHASLLLMNRSLALDYSYFHLISGQDLLIKTKAELDNLLSNFEGKNFINHYKTPVTSMNDALEPFLHYDIRADTMPKANYLHYAFKNGTALFNQKWFPKSKTMKLIQKQLGGIRTFWRLYYLLFKRTPPAYDFYIGSAWMSITKELCAYFCTESQASPALLHFLRHAAFPDEIYFHTLAMNSKYKGTLINSDLRYVKWIKNSHSPKLLSLDDLPNLKASNGVFARKWNIQEEQEFQDIQRLRLC